MTLLIFEKSNLLLGFIPESIGMLIFGIGLIALAIGLRAFLERFENEAFVDSEPVRNFAARENGESKIAVKGQLKVSEK